VREITLVVTISEYNQLFAKSTSIVAGHSPNHATITCSRHVCMGVILRAHPVHGESHNQGSADTELAITYNMEKLTSY